MGSLMCHLLQLLLAFASSLHQAHAQSSPGFINLDCGLRDTNGYNDPGTDLYYTTDEDYIETGESRSISPEYKADSVPRRYYNVRSFPGPEGTRHCYTLKPQNYGGGKRIMVRVGFRYGNYDDKNKPPKFDLYFGVNYWETVSFENASSHFHIEIIHKLSSEYVHVCVVNTGHGEPFVSVIKLRVMDPWEYVYEAGPGSLKISGRWNLGTTSTKSIRYKDDPYDRIWRPYTLKNADNSNSIASTLKPNRFRLPPLVMSTAAEAPTTNDYLNISFTPNNPSNEYYFYWHFAEFVPNKTRNMTIRLNGKKLHKPFVPPYLVMHQVFNKAPLSHPKYEFMVAATSDSELPAMLNAFEIYTVKQFPYYQTHDGDVAAITSIKETYAITSNWQGDPCSPEKFSWNNINCTSRGFDQPPNIISLNLSSSRLNGTIASSISNLTMLKSLDLSYNTLTGNLPDFLAWFPSLEYLALQGNNFSGRLPPVLLEKWKKGSLTLRHESLLPHKKKKNTPIVPIAASLGSFFSILAFATLLCMILRRNRKDVRRSKGNSGSGIEPKLRRLKYSKVLSFIGDEKKVLGGGGFGNVYLGCMDGVQVAIKVFKVSPEHETKDFEFEVKILATVYHKNLTRILGYCNEGLNKAIIIELMENGNLKTHLSEENPNVLSWEQRLTILIGAAEGLEYLHHGCKPAIIHRDTKPENILLTKEFEAKLGDFGFSRIFPVESSRVIGTLGYLDPEYKEPSMLSEKIDIYSFGVVILAVVTGKSAIVKGTSTHITQWVENNITNGDIASIVDPRLDGDYTVSVCWRIVELGIACVSSSSSGRPSMNHVVKELKDCMALNRDGGGITVLPSETTSGASTPNAR